MSKIRVSAIQRGCVYDGPGVRTTVFLKGCTLHCPWCCNPENISLEQEWFFDDSKCIKYKGIASELCASCKRNDGERAIAECPFSVAEPVCHDWLSSDLFLQIEKDKELFGKSGGVTFSGGEPLMQADALLPVLEMCKKQNVNIAFETTLYVGKKNIAAVIPYADIMIVDLKLQPELGDIPNYIDCISENLDLIKKQGINVFYRLVFVNSLITIKEKICKQLKSLGVEEIELLKCHHLGAKKYEKLNKKSVDFTADERLFQNFSEYLQLEQLKVTQLKV